MKKFLSHLGCFLFALGILLVNQSVKAGLNDPPENAPDGSPYKVVIIGDSGVGKTAIMNRILNNEFIEDLNSTIAANFSSTLCTLSSEIKIRLDVWDTAGQERFSKAFTPGYLRGSAVVVIVCSSEDKNSQQNVSTRWAKMVKDTIELPPGNIIVVLNKVDLIEDTNRFQNNISIPDGVTHIIKTSSKTGENIDILTQTIANIAFYDFPDYLKNSNKLIHIQPHNPPKKSCC